MPFRRKGTQYMISISSASNSRIKRIALLQSKSKARVQEQSFVIEGRKEIKLALRAGYKIEEVYYCPAICSADSLKELISRYQIETIAEISKLVYQKIAYRASTEGVLAVARMKSHGLQLIKSLAENALVLIAEAPEKPGNIGALLRTADAAKLDAVFLADLKTDLYNPNIIRASLGCVFSVPIFLEKSDCLLQFLKAQKITTYGAVVDANTAYHTQDYIGATAIAVGTESTGLSKTWLSHTKHIQIPMHGLVDSMNVSVAAGILIFEAKRQRGFY